MKLNKIITTLGLCLGVAHVASAQTTVYITGATAFRSQVYNAFIDLGLTPGSPTPNGALTGSSNSFTFTGSFTDPKHLLANFGDPTAIGGSYNVYATFSGSANGVNELIFPGTVNYTNIPGNASFTHTGADLAFSVVAQASTYDYNASVQLTDIDSVDATNAGINGIAVQPLTFAANSQGLASNIVNIDDEEFNALVGNGTADLDFWTGITTDSNSIVYITGGDINSAVRIDALAQAGDKVNNVIQQNELNNSTHQWLGVGNGGYSSQSLIRAALNDSLAPPAIGYLDLSDAAALTSGGPISYNGNSVGTINHWNLESVINGRYTYWSYVHLYFNKTVHPSPSDTITTKFGPAVVLGVEYESTNTFNLTPAGLANTAETALPIGLLNVSRAADGATVVHN
jgi:hypothetical protein